MSIFLVGRGKKRSGLNSEESGNEPDQSDEQVADNKNQETDVPSRNSGNKGLY